MEREKEEHEMKNINTPYQEDLLQLSSNLSKLLKRRFGKGPESCFVTLNSNRLAVYLRNYITPAEEVLIENKNVHLAKRFRSAVMDHVFLEFAPEASSILQITLDTFNHDWDYETNTGILLLEGKNSNKWVGSAFETSLKESLFEEIIRISAEVHKVPQSIEMIKLNQNIVAVESKGIMLQIENILVEKGHLDLLQEQTIEIKNIYLNQKSVFTKIFGRKVESIFISWDYKNDRSYIFFCLK